MNHCNIHAFLTFLVFLSLVPRFGQLPTTLAAVSTFTRACASSKEVVHHHDRLLDCGEYGAVRSFNFLAFIFTQTQKKFPLSELMAKADYQDFDSPFINGNPVPSVLSDVGAGS
ncbi:MAG: hypothetical protein BYD32DRAFT_450184 [Podila humilis]|nr:MAG: hypothetical protein BYD32DRAFT_450184 [Podila humilis]